MKMLSCLIRSVVRHPSSRPHLKPHVLQLLQKQNNVYSLVLYNQGKSWDLRTFLV